MTQKAQNYEDVGILISNLSAAGAKAMELSLTPFMLTPLEYGVLNKCHVGEATTVTELARIFPVNASTISRLVGRLVSRRLIGRQRVLSDRRTVKLKLTDEGRSLVENIEEYLSASRAVLMEGVSEDEREVFASIVQKVTANSEALKRKAQQPGPPIDLAWRRVLMFAPVETT